MEHGSVDMQMFLKLVHACHLSNTITQTYSFRNLKKRNSLCVWADTLFASGPSCLPRGVWTSADPRRGHTSRLLTHRVRFTVNVHVPINWQDYINKLRSYATIPFMQTLVQIYRKPATKCNTVLNVCIYYVIIISDVCSCHFLSLKYCFVFSEYDVITKQVAVIAPELNFISVSWLIKSVR